MNSGADSEVSAGRPAAWYWWLVPMLLWLGGGALRVHLTFADAEFNEYSARGLLKSDPGLLYYLTERVLEADGGTPEDWRADERIEHPHPVDIPATFTVGQEFLIAHTYRWFGQGVPLHVFCVWLMSFVASLAVVGVFGATWALGHSPGWATVAGLLFALTPANYRTIGFVLIREDLSLPLYAMHLWAFARALPGGRSGPGESTRTRPFAAVWAVLTLGAALATWHGMGFFVALEGMALLATFVLHGSHALVPRTGRLAFLVLPLFVLLVPALRAKVPDGPLWILVGCVLWLSACLPERLRRGWSARLVSVLLLAGALLAAVRFLGNAQGDLSHVTALVAGKLRHLGQFPSDPGVLPFDVRLLWQGPFETSTAASLWASLGLLTAFLALGGLVLTRGSGPRGSALGGFLALALVSGWLVARMLVLVGLLGPILVGLAGSRGWSSVRLPARRIAWALLLVHGLLFARWARGFAIGWYQPSLRQGEIAAMVEALPQLVPAGEAVASDFMNSTAILAHTGRGIVLQPKWESARSRERVEQFWTLFYHGTPGDLRDLLLHEFDCRYLLVDRFTLWTLRASRRVAGLGSDVSAPLPGTAAEALLDPETPVPGYELIWRSPQTFLQSNGRPSDFFRLYRLED